jgi:hypothetical protein
MPHAPPTYILTHLYSLIWASAQHILSSIVCLHAGITAWSEDLSCHYQKNGMMFTPVSMIYLHTYFRDIPSHLFPWYTFTPVSVIYLQQLAMNLIASTCFMLRNWITLHTLTFDRLVSGPAIIQWKLYSSMTFTVLCSSCMRQSACTRYILKFMVRWCCVMWVMVLTCVLKLPCTFN